jgi:hypothetical protein
MRSNKLVVLGGKMLAAGRTVGGLLLVLVAVASPASAQQCNNMVPEIDPGSLTGAVTLLVGGALVLADRLRR